MMVWPNFDRLQLDTALGPALDVQDVVDAAWALKVSEFNLFLIAYRRWFGREPDHKQLERIFAHYLFQQAVPGWVRLLCRQVQQVAAAGPLDRRAFGADALPRREPIPQTPRRVPGIAAISVLFVYLLCVVLL
jgi:hypothetical protein